MITKYDTTEKVILIIIILIGIIALGFWSGELSIERIDSTDGTGTEVETGTEPHSFDDLLDAIEWVESKGVATAIGDNGNAVGPYQIWKIFVDDVNRIKKLNTSKYDTFLPYKYEHRTDFGMSRRMATVYLKHYGGTLEEMARKFNGGPQGHKKKATEAYWSKVKARMERE